MNKHLYKPALLVLLLASCTSFRVNETPSPNRSWDHWNAASIAPRIDRFFLGYDSDIDGSFSNKLSNDFAHVRKTCARVFLHHNEDNPFQY